MGFPLLVSPHVNLSTSARNVSILSLTHHGKNRWLSGLSGDIWSDHWATHHATLTAICLCQHHEVRAGAEVTSHCLRPTSARFQLEQDDQVGPGDLELARYSFKSKGYTAKHRIVQENDDQALEGQVVGRACCGGIYILDI